MGITDVISARFQAVSACNRAEIACWRAVIVFMCSALLVASCANTEAAPGTPASSITLVDLTDPAAVAGWTTVNDPVMGGKSTSQVTFGDGALQFSGDISLQNNGGFASARSRRDPDIGRRASGALSIAVHAVGDGKTYLLKVGVGNQPWSYAQRFSTQAGVQGIYQLPVTDFAPVGMRLNPAPEAPQHLDPSAIDQVSVYILDKQQGAFRIAISAIDAVR